MSNTRKQAAEKLVASLRGKRIEIGDIFQEAPAPRQSYHSSDGKDHTIVPYVRFEETEAKYKGLEKEIYRSIYFDNLGMSNIDLKSKGVPVKLRRFLEQELNGGKVVFLPAWNSMKSKQSVICHMRCTGRGVTAEISKVVFTLDPDKHKPEKIFKTGIIRKTDRLADQRGKIWLSYPISKQERSKC